MIVSADNVRTWIREALAVDKEVFTTREACAFLQISDRTLFTLLEPRGDLPHYKVAEGRRFLKADLLNYVRAHRVTAENAAAPSAEPGE